MSGLVNEIVLERERERGYVDHGPELLRIRILE